MTNLRIKDSILREAFSKQVGGFIRGESVMVFAPSSYVNRMWKLFYEDYKNNVQTRLKVRGLSVVK